MIQFLSAPSRDTFCFKAKADRVEGDRTAVAVRRLGEPTPGHRVRQHPTPLRRRHALAQHRLTRRREAAKGTAGLTKLCFASPRLRVTLFVLPSSKRLGGSLALPRCATPWRANSSPPSPPAPNSSPPPSRTCSTQTHGKARSREGNCRPDSILLRVSASSRDTLPCRERLIKSVRR